MSERSSWEPTSVAVARSGGRQRNAAEEAELARLIAEQTDDDTPWVKTDGRRSLDAPIASSDGAYSLVDMLGDHDEQLLDLVGENETFLRLVTTRGVSDEDLKFWRYLRTRQGWTYKRIADHVGVNVNTVLRHISKRRGERLSPQGLALKSAEKRAVVAYDAGARLIDVAQVLYQEAGYKTPESCYQALRRLFLARGHAIRPQSWKHGRRSRAASRETYIAYWKEYNRAAAERRRATLRKCEATTRERKPCSRWARHGTTLCNVHAGLSGGPTIWTPEAILAALNGWRVAHGCYPRPRDWTHAAVEHPNFKTVYGQFPSWPAALQRATFAAFHELKEAA
jgi:hypothetical protein